ncbi:HCLS1-associated protein X-1 isoform X2 [Rhinatrema bivittatum]|uniref:HCLS1-associated protein X-1 isoform X2 n=1 Tax=Rhinatrema bivittatum TaxID=194408 RepID=UPI0011274D99|nr:HCLS1-associated protein X-1 isoform X2 [Rhinatrema bivittatum]
MSVYDLFKGFIGLPRRRDPFFGGIILNDEEEDDNEEDGAEGSGYSFGSRPPQDFAFGFSYGPGRAHFHDYFGFEEFFRDFNELFRDLPSIEAPPSAADSASDKKGQSIRDSMLKYPDSHLPQLEEPLGSQGEPHEQQDRWEPFSSFEDTWKIFPNPGYKKTKQDEDLDSQVSSQGLDDILKAEEPRPRSYFQSISVTKVIGADGCIEEHRTVQDSQGNKETTITRRNGTQTLITSTKNQQGKEQPTENMMNMEDRNLTQFIDGWKQNQGEETLDLTDHSSILDKFFQRWFSKQ